MQVAIVSTMRPNMRAQIEGWTFEDSSLFVRQSLKGMGGEIYIGFTPGPKYIPIYGTVLEMLADGWVLLGPPQAMPSLCGAYTLDERTTYDWWLTRDKKEGE